jgi:hypothetical protein
MKAEISSKTSVTEYERTRHRIPDDLNLNEHRCEKLRSRFVQNAPIVTRCGFIPARKNMTRVSKILFKFLVTLF